MVHTFCSLGQYIALDVESGAVHSLDLLAYEILNALKAGESREEIARKLEGHYPRQDIADTFDDIDELITGEQLFTEAEYTQENLPASSGVIKAMCLHAAHDCNLRCSYCFASTGGFGMQRSLLSYETGKAAIDFLIKNSGKRKNLEIDFFGGEPLMNLDVVKRLVEYGRQQEKETGKVFQFTITTNGINLDAETIAFINREMGNVVISLDGRKETHDRMRPTINGKGSYDLILPMAMALAESRDQDRYYVRGTFTAHNLDFGWDVLALADAGFRQISLEPVVTDEANDYALKEEHVPALIEEYERLAAEYLKRKQQGNGFNFFHFMIDLTGGPCLIKRLVGCGAGNEYVAVTPEGDIYPCHQFVGNTDYKMGNVNEETFDRAMQTDFQKNNVLNKEECVKCWAKYYCSGGCAANSVNQTGDRAKPYTLGCALVKKRLECALALYILENEKTGETVDF